MRKWARDGAQDELDLDSTIRKTAENGYLDVQTRPERHNAVKVILLLDVGGSMDPHIKLVEELFSAARSEFKNLESYYFHNCLYEGIWRDNERRWNKQVPTDEVFRTYGPDYKCIFLFDHSCGHDKKRPDSLNAGAMGKGYGGSQPKMRNTKIKKEKGTKAEPG